LSKKVFVAELRKKMIELQNSLRVIRRFDVRRAKESQGEG